MTCVSVFTERLHARPVAKDGNAGGTQSTATLAGGSSQVNQMVCDKK